MSKWSSARSRGAIALLMACAVAACSRENQSDHAPAVRGNTIVEPETRVDAVPQEEPAVVRQQWRAVSQAARGAVGNLRVSIEGVRGGPVVFAFANGVTIRAQPINVAPSDQRSGVDGQSFAAVLGGDPRVDTHLYRVLEENISRSAGQGLCGAQHTRHLAVSEFVDSAGRWVFKVAAFKGERPPGGSGEDPQLCTAFAYTAAP
ncbi:MAG TPA: hypothetical protein VG841_06005 [Caulobacterales bacterium]|nr:hypothetical protein [Caulobacterales bacterium]